MPVFNMTGLYKSGGGGAWTQICDMIPHGGYYTGGTTKYVDTDEVYNYVVPLVAGRTYLLRVVTTGNRLRVSTWATNPIVAASGSNGVRSLIDVSPSVGYESLFVAGATETYLNIYYTNQGDSGVIINVYEATLPNT